MSSSRVFSGFLLLSISFILVSAFRPGGTVQGACVVFPTRCGSLLTEPSSDAQLAARDQHDTINITEYALTDTMKGTLQKLEDLETMPSCEKVASAELMYSCAAIDGTVIAEEDGIPRGADHLLDVQKTLYAARLAVCELNVGKDSVPAACQAFVTTPKSTRKTFWRSSSVSRGWKGFWQTYPVYEEATEATLEQCLVALQRCGPCWNSYSNSRQNAVHICHAMRAEREKDEQIHLFKVLANTAWDLTGTMGQSKEQWKETQTLMHDFTDYIRRFWQDLVKDNAEELQRTSRLWADVEIGVRGGLADILADVREAQSVLVDTRRSLTEHHQNINTTVQDTSAQLTDLVASQYDAMGVLSYSGDQLNDKLAYIHETLMQDLALRIYNATQDLDNTNVLMGVFNQQLNQSSVTLSRTMGQLDALRSEIDDLRQSLQRAHADNERMTLEMQAKANRTLEIADQANENMEKLGSGIASLSEFLSGGWAGAIGILEKTATFAMYALIYSLLNFGGWQCLTRYSTLGCAAASTATGLGKDCFFCNDH